MELRTRWCSCSLCWPEAERDDCWCPAWGCLGTVIIFIVNLTGHTHVDTGFPERFNWAENAHHECGQHNLVGWGQEEKKGGGEEKVSYRLRPSIFLCFLRTQWPAASSACCAVRAPLAIMGFLWQCTLPSNHEPKQVLLFLVLHLSSILAPRWDIKSFLILC